MIATLSVLLAEAQQVDVKPNAKGIPGLTVLSDMVGGTLVGAGLLCLLAMAGAGVGVAVSKHMNNSMMGTQSKSYLTSAAAGAVIVGGAVALTNWFLRAGSTIG